MLSCSHSLIYSSSCTVPLPQHPVPVNHSHAYLRLSPWEQERNLICTTERSSWGREIKGSIWLPQHRFPVPSEMSWAMHDMHSAGRQDTGPKGDLWSCGRQAGDAGTLQREERPDLDNWTESLSRGKAFLWQQGAEPYQLSQEHPTYRTAVCKEGHNTVFKMLTAGLFYY